LEPKFEFSGRGACERERALKHRLINQQQKFKPTASGTPEAWVLDTEQKNGMPHRPIAAVSSNVTYTFSIRDCWMPDACANPMGCWLRLLAFGFEPARTCFLKTLEPKKAPRKVPFLCGSGG
jgi:hypothetical protein